VTLTVNSIGIIVKEGTQFLILVSTTKKKPLQFYLITLDARSSALVSPFYEHLLTLNECEGEGCEGVLLFTLTKWHSHHFRIPIAVTDPQEYAKLAREIVRHSFFPLLMNPSCGKGFQPWHSECFNWHIFNHGLATAYAKEFSLETWLGKELTGNQFWTEFSSDNPGNQEVVKSLSLTSALPPHDLGQLYSLFDQWRQYRYIAGYFKYRLLDMAVAHRVETQGIVEVHHANLSSERLRDLDTLYHSLSTGEDGVYKEFNILMGQTVRPGVLQSMMDHFHTTLQRQSAVGRLIVRKIVCETEIQARKSPSTIYPVSVKSILYHYQQMFGLKSDAKPEAITLFEPPLPEKEGLKFEIDHGEEIVNSFVRALTSPQPYAFAELPWHWILPPLVESVSVKPATTLFYVSAKEEINKQEEALHTLVKETLHTQCETHESPASLGWDPVEEQKRYDALDDIDRSLYDLRITSLLYRPLELVVDAPPDMEVLHKLMWENIFTCSVVRPRGSDYTLRRVSHYFFKRGEIRMEDLHNRFFEPETVVEKSLIIVLDCHLFSVSALLGLFQWLYRHRSVVRRLVMLGASDTLPLKEEGQAWIDLLGWQGFETPLFRHVELNASFDRLVEILVEQGRVVLHNYREDLQERLTRLFKKRERRPNSVTIYCLVSVEEASKRQPSFESVMTMVETSLNSKYRTNNNIQIVRITLVELTTLPLSRFSPRTRQLFFISQRYMKLLSRNELNHLLMEIPGEGSALTVVCEAVSSSFGWLRKSPSSHPSFPNSRFTMAYLKKLGVQQ